MPMRTIALLISLSSFLLLLSACGQRPKEVVNSEEEPSIKEINLVGPMEDSGAPFKLSDAALSVDVVPLEVTDRSLIASIKQVVVTSDGIFIRHNRSQQVFRFDRSGKFLNTIGKVGQGPEEYIRMYQFFIDEQRREVYIVPTVGYTQVYTMDGDYVRQYGKVNLEMIFKQFTNRIFMYGQTVFLEQSGPVYQPVNQPEDSLWAYAIADNELMPSKLFLNPGRAGHAQDLVDNMAPVIGGGGWKNYLIERSPTTDFYQGEFWMKYADVDTIYRYHAGDSLFVPNYSIKIGDRTRQEDYFRSHLWLKERSVFDSPFIYAFYNTRDYIYLTGNRGETLYTYRYDKAAGTIAVSKREEKIQESRIPTLKETYKWINSDFILTNDYSGGDYLVQYTSGNYWISVFDADMENLDINRIKQGVVSDEPGRERLLKALEGLDNPDSNPVLLIANLK